METCLENRRIVCLENRQYACIGDTSKIIVKRYWIALEIALYKFIITIIIIIIFLLNVFFLFTVTNQKP